MKYEVKVLLSAKEDVAEIIYYLSGQSEQAPKKFADDLKDKIRSLSGNPLLFEVYHDYPFYRRVVVGEYLVLYHIAQDKNIVEIHAVIHARRDVKKLIGQNSRKASKN